VIAGCQNEVVLLVEAFPDFGHVFSASSAPVIDNAAGGVKVQGRKDVRMAFLDFMDQDYDIDSAINQEPGQDEHPVKIHG